MRQDKPENNDVDKSEQPNNCSCFWYSDGEYEIEKTCKFCGGDDIEYKRLARKTI